MQNHYVLKETVNHLSKLARWLSRNVSISLYVGFDFILL